MTSSSEEGARDGAFRTTVLSVDDEAVFQSFLGDALREDCDLLTASTAEEASAVLAGRDTWVDVILLDMRLSYDGEGLDLIPRLRAESRGSPIIVLTTVRNTRAAVQAMKLGAVDYLEKSASRIELRDRIRVALSDLDSRLRERFRLRTAHGVLREMVGQGPAMTRLRRRISLASRMDDEPVLIAGERGTGKELVARILHGVSGRRGPCIVRSCGDMPSELFAGLLFGTSRGAFTNATDRPGWLEEASNGTLFLDEITKADRECQGALLRVMEYREFLRLGAREEGRRRFEGQILLATNEPLEQAVSGGLLLEDFLDRTAMTIEVPPLRDRREDIPLLAEYFRTQFSPPDGPFPMELSQNDLALLSLYDWPGNVRQLRKAIRLYATSCSEGMSLADAVSLAGRQTPEPAGCRDRSGNPAPPCPDTGDLAGDRVLLPIGDLLHLDWKRSRECLLARYLDLYLPRARKDSAGERGGLYKRLGLSGPGARKLLAWHERNRQKPSDTSRP